MPSRASKLNAIAASLLALGMVSLSVSNYAVAAPVVVSSSEPTTEGERRLLEPDWNKTFKPEMARFGTRGTVDTKEAKTASYTQGKEFADTKSFSTKRFSASEFLPPALTNSGKSFSTNTANLPASQFSLPGPETFSTKSFESKGSGLGDKQFASFTSKDASKGFAGQEAERMKEKYTPANPPHGGVSTGHKLTVEEVRDLLNKSK